MGFTSHRLAEAAALRSTMEQFLIERHMGSMTTAGMSVTAKTVRGIPAVGAAVSFAAEAVATLTMKVWRPNGPPCLPVTSTWQARLFMGAQPGPAQSWFEFWETVQASLDYRGNAYIWKTKGAGGRVEALTALHPDQVNPYRSQHNGPLTYPVSFSELYPVPPEITGYGALDAGADRLLHIRGRGGTGELVAPSPIAIFKTALGVALAKQDHEANLYGRGAGYGLLVKFPQGISPEKGHEWREVFDSEHAGTHNSGKTKVIGGGAEVSNITMSQVDAQFVEAYGLSIQEVSLIFRVPGWFLGRDQKVDKPLSPEHEQTRWVVHGLTPRTSRIEAALRKDPDLFGGSDRPAFDTSDLIHGDRATEDAIAHQQTQDGRVLVDEWRVEHGRPELPDGLGKIPQITPVGGAPNSPSNQGGQDASDD